MIVLVCQPLGYKLTLEVVFFDKSDKSAIIHTKHLGKRKYREPK